jgi:hypothetical protein
MLEQRGRGALVNNGGNHQHSCEEIFHAILLSIDHELNDPTLEVALTQHCEQCPPCSSTMVAHQQNVALLKSLLGGACQEVAPKRLHAQLLAQTEALAAQMQAEQLLGSEFGVGTFTQTFSQTTITIDGQTTIEISHTQEFREGF